MGGRAALRSLQRTGLEALVHLAARRAPSLPEPPRDPESIFVLRNNDVGDLLVITPLFEALRRRFPRARIAAGIGDWNRDVLLHNPHLSEVLPVNAPWFNKYAGRQRPRSYLRTSPEVRALASRRFEIGIDVLGSTWGSLLLMKAGIPYRIGVRGYAGGHSGAQATVPFDPDLHVGRAALRVAELLGATDLPENRPQIFLTAEEKEAAERAWDAAGPGERIVIGPGAGLPGKGWPLRNYTELAASLPGDSSILVLGGLHDDEAVSEIAAAHPRAWHPPQPPPLRHVFALVAAADRVLCNSSMLMHAAAAFARPTLVLLGESFPSARQHQRQWGYPGVCRSLGKEAGERGVVYAPEEVLKELRAYPSGPERPATRSFPPLDEIEPVA
ncbi:MAG: glycosyltransferase family 9 protein [Thermoanaerobaculia bacterium]